MYVGSQEICRELRLMANATQDDASEEDGEADEEDEGGDDNASFASVDDLEGSSSALSDNLTPLFTLHR